MALQYDRRSRDQIAAITVRFPRTRSYGSARLTFGHLPGREQYKNGLYFVRINVSILTRWLPPNYGRPTTDASKYNRLYNVTTIQHRLNNKRNNNLGWPLGSQDTTGHWPDVYMGICEGTGVCLMGTNIPLNSPHPGGVNFLMADGSVSFISDELGLDVLGRFATKDDGQVISVE